MTHPTQEEIEKVATVNEYTPWVELGISELDYWKKRYLEARAELAHLQTPAVGDEEELDHPCRDSCSGWKQAYEKGRASMRGEVEGLRSF